MAKLAFFTKEMMEGSGFINPQPVRGEFLMPVRGELVEP